MGQVYSFSPLISKFSDILLQLVSETYQIIEITLKLQGALNVTSAHCFLLKYVLSFIM